jgi:hypothetical protein
MTATVAIAGATFTMGRRGADNLIPASAALVAVLWIELRGAGAARGAWAAVFVAVAQCVAVGFAASRGESAPVHRNEAAALRHVWADGVRVVRARFPVREMLEYLGATGVAPALDVRVYQDGDNAEAVGDEGFVCVARDRDRFLKSTAAGRPLVEAFLVGDAGDTEAIVVLYPKRP